MIAALDSAMPPSAAQVDAALKSGVGAWSGYLATSGAGASAFGLYRVWTEAEFAVVKALPARPIAFCSGFDNPAGCAALASSWGVRLCLDVEGGIRGDGPWVQGWLDAAPGCGLYGNGPVHNGRSAAFHILAGYPTSGDPDMDTWNPAYAPRPAGPVGWQWAGTHSEFGIGVDRSWIDDWFGGDLVLDAETKAYFDNEFAELRADVRQLNNDQPIAQYDPYHVPTQGHAWDVNAEARARRKELLDAIKAGPVGAVDLSPVLAQDKAILEAIAALAAASPFGDAIAIEAAKQEVLKAIADKHTAVVSLF